MNKSRILLPVTYKWSIKDLAFGHQESAKEKVAVNL